MSKKFIYVNTAAEYEESPGAFEETDFLSTSAGAGDAGKPIVLDADGKIDASMIDSADVDHGQLTGLGDDDHTQYILVDGTRAFTGIQSYNTHPTFTTDTQIVDKKYVDDQIAATGTAAEWQDSCIDILLTPPVSPSTGDRYLITGGTATGAWVGQEENIAEWNGSTWDFTTPTTGTYVSVDDETDGLYYFGGSTWQKKFYESTTASTGLEKVGVDIRVNFPADGSLYENGSNELAIQFSTTFNDQRAVAAADLASTANGEGASIIGIEDAGAYFTATDVEGALAELAANAATSGVEYTVGTGGVTKGDLLAVTSNNTVQTKSTLTAATWGVGLAATTEIATATVNSLSNDTVLTGVLTGATAGTRYFWNGTGYSTTAPLGSGQYVWQVGVAKNATDLHVEVMFIKKNA